MELKIGLIGGGGLIGSAIKKELGKSYHITQIKSENLYSNEQKLASLLSGQDIIINLAGYPIAGRWNARVKKLIYNSRISTTRNLVSAIELLKDKPLHLINASAVGIYADNEICDEKSENLAGNFLAKVVNDWEKEAGRIEAQAVNLTIIRLGVVLSRSGGAYPILRKIFKLGAGGKIGNGKQGFSFILIDDLVSIIDYLIKNKIYGIVNAVAPTPVNNEIFTMELAKVLRRPAFFPVPAFVLKILYREGSSTLLQGQRVIPRVLMNHGFSFVGNNLTLCLEILEK